MPVQNLSSGYVHIEILEAYVVRVNVIGKTHGLENYLDNYAQQLKKSRPLRLKVLQYYYILHNFPIGVNDNHLDIYTDYIQIKPTLNIAPASGAGKAGDLGAYFYHPFILQANDKLEGRLAFGYYRSKTSSFNSIANAPDAVVRLPSLRAKDIYERNRTRYFDRMEAELSQGMRMYSVPILHHHLVFLTHT